MACSFHHHLITTFDKPQSPSLRTLPLYLDSPNKFMVASFGQVVVGSPGAGKTTYCNGMSCYLRALGRQVAIINLDPANDNPPYKADVDMGQLVTLQVSPQEIAFICPQS